MIEDFVEQHQILGNAVARIIHEHVAGLATRRVTPEATPAELEKLFDEPLPEKGIAIEEILARFKKTSLRTRWAFRARDTSASLIRRRCRLAFGQMR